MFEFRLEKVLWAVDPFALPKDLQISAAWAIRTLVKSTEALTQPIYLYETDFQKFMKEVPSDFQKEIQTSAKDELDEILRRVQIPKIQPILTLPTRTLTLRNRVQTLLDYASESSTDLIVISTHARKGLQRWMVGSFAETTLLTSKTPLLVVNPKWNHVPEFDHIIYPTGYSSSEKSAFNYVLGLSKRLKAKITLFHKVQHPWFPFTDVAFSNATFFKDLIENEVTNKQNEGSRWKDFSESQGVSTSLHFDFNPNGSIDESILNYVKDHPGLIIMSDQTDAQVLPLLGSISRNVVRLSNEPVWMIKTPNRTAI